MEWDKYMWMRALTVRAIATPYSALCLKIYMCGKHMCGSTSRWVSLSVCMDGEVCGSEHTYNPTVI